MGKCPGAPSFAFFAKGGIKSGQFDIRGCVLRQKPKDGAPGGLWDFQRDREAEVNGKESR